MSRAHRWSLPALLGAMLAHSAHALDAQLAGAPLHLNISEYATAAYHLDNGNIAPAGSPLWDPTASNYADWLNRFQVDGAWRELTLTARLDSALFLNAPVAAPGDVRFEHLLAQRYRNRLDVEKIALAWTSRHLDVTIGDVYATFGRGLVLALRKVDVLGVDTTARGASLTARLGELTVNALGGVSNIINVDAATGRTADDPNDLLLGARADYRIGRWLVPGVNASWVRMAQNAQTTTPQAAQDQVVSYSGSLEAPSLFGHGSAYVEYARQRRLVGDRGFESSALYASTSLTFGPATLLAELKDYRRYAPIQTSLDSTRAPELALTNTYTALPTLERLEQAVLNNSDVTGPRLRVDLTVSDTVTPFVSVAAFVDRIYAERIVDAYAGCEVSWQDGRSRGSGSLGYRPSFHDEGSLLGAGALDAAVWHAKYLASQWLFGPYSLELNGLHMSHRDEVAGRLVPWMEGQAYLSLKRAGSWAVALGYEYFTEAPETTRTQYLNVNASWTVSQSLTLRAFAGGQRGGIKCVNGICRTYPAFDGARLEVVVKY